MCSAIARTTVSQSGAIDAVPGAVERQQPRAGYLAPEGLAMLEREHRIRGSVDHERGHGDRRRAARAISPSSSSAS